MNTILAQADSQGFDPMNLIFIVGMFVVLYFFMIRPQQKKQKDQKKYVDSLSKGKEVVTIGGIHGKIYSVESDTVVIEVDKSTKIKVSKTAIANDTVKK